MAVDRLVLKKGELDKACKDKKHKYHDDFAVELRFVPLPALAAGSTAI